MDQKVFKRFITKVKIPPNANNCWEWQANLDKDGYGKITVQNIFWRAHRFSYFIFNKEHPAKNFVMHKCDNPKCVNPSHLMLGNSILNNRDRDNKKRGFYSKRTQCKNGHKFSVENTRHNNNTRICKTCDKQRSATYRLFARTIVD